MRSDDALFLDMLIAARRILRYVRGMDESAFGSDEMAQSAVIRELQVIGEAARLIHAQTRSVHPQIDWRMIIGMRNRLVHEYFAIRQDVVWQTVQDDIPPLAKTLELLVPPENEIGKAFDDDE